MRDDCTSIVGSAFMFSFCFVPGLALVPGPALHRVLNAAALLAMCLMAVGCSLIPEARTRDSLHNPFPQLKRIAVLPFFNQSDSPHVDGEAVARAYYAALQGIPGFEVLPVGVTAIQWRGFASQFGEPRTGAEFQRLAQMMDVEAIVVGSVTDFDSYYPPRMGLTVHWYAANEGFHAIPPGYGLPWGTEAQDKIPARITREAEFELARSQLKTQAPQTEAAGAAGDAGPWLEGTAMPIAGLPAQWPEPTDLIPDPPQPIPPPMIRQHEPVLSHTRLYRGDDPYFTARLADWVETGDDARGMSWQGYIKRSEDFIRFCCHLHITEMLESRGGQGPSDLILRWPLSRY